MRNAVSSVVFKAGSENRRREFATLTDSSPAWQVARAVVLLVDGAIGVDDERRDAQPVEACEHVPPAAIAAQRAFLETSASAPQSKVPRATAPETPRPREWPPLQWKILPG